MDLMSFEKLYEWLKFNDFSTSAIDEMTGKEDLVDFLYFRRGDAIWATDGLNEWEFIFLC